MELFTIWFAPPRDGAGWPAEEREIILRIGGVDMLKARLTDIRKIEIVDEPRPVPQAGEVLVKVAYAGVCGSDMHAFLGEHPFVKPPMVLGHECAGVVADDSNPRFKPGEKVVLEPNVVCGECYNCRRGRYNICSNLSVIGCVGREGGYAEYIAVPEDRLVRLPAAWDLKRGVMVEPASVCTHAARHGQVCYGDRALVIGAGTIGLLMMQALLALGASEVVVSDVLDWRLEVARGLGATHVVNTRNKSLADFVSERYPEGLDLIFDGVANEATMNQCIELARKGTRIVVLGVPEGKVNINLAFVQDRELELLGTLMYTRGDYNEAIELIDSGKMNVDRLVTHVYPLEKAQEAVEASIAKHGNVIKVLLDCTGK